MSNSTVTLTDRYTKRSGEILISGVQALVRLMMLQAERDKLAGLNTGGFVSGYRGSPLGTLDSTFASAKKFIDPLNIVVKPAVNEELGATAVAGSQQIDRTTGAKVEGVFSLWYGKGPGVDRASDAIRHGNIQGASAKGGVVLAVGDDHVAKSSSITCYSDETIISLQIPLFYPADPAEVVTFGLHGFALSRYSGSWAALKILTEVADSSRVVPADEWAFESVLPPVQEGALGLHNHWPNTPLEQELRQQKYRLAAIKDYLRANQLDKSVGRQADSKIGIVAGGKSWNDLKEALTLLGLDSQEKLAALGISLYKPAVIWPLDTHGISRFGVGLKHLVVIEEKTGLVESQIKSAFYNLEEKPVIWGKTGPDDKELFPTTADLTPEFIAARLGAVLASLDTDSSLTQTVARAEAYLQQLSNFAVAPAVRTPFFCSGCPHNRSTVVPQGSVAMAGIGCHGLAAYLRPRTESFAQMGGEGIHWMGLSPFTEEAHRFANMGDGTYFHSGLLAVRQAVAAQLTITYKLLYNSAVAMTGGQQVDGELSVLQVVQQLKAEGVKVIILCSDEPERYRKTEVSTLVNRIEHRDELEALQLQLRDSKGVSVIVYEQVCATEKRRLRKRGKMLEPTTRVFINELVCEGCGDCSVKSNCLSVEPVKTDFGNKRRINQSSCNKDYSCVNGFCPSFVTVDGGQPRKKKSSVAAQQFDLPSPLALDHLDHQRVLVAGVGGTGVVTIGALLTMSGHMQGLHAAVLDQVGMAQKGGAVTSHVHVSSQPINALRIPVEHAHLIIACDQIVGNAKDVIAAAAPGKTFVLANADVSITGEFTKNRDAVGDAEKFAQRLTDRVGPDNFVAYPFTQLSERLLGDAIGSNLMMVGFAYQKGWLQINQQAYMQALELNGTAVELNKSAFNWGRRLAVEPQAVYDSAELTERAAQTLEQIVQQRVEFLTAYQDAGYAERYRAVVAKVEAAEKPFKKGSKLAEAAARSLFKLMAYKDEYEVARLYTDGSFKKSLESQFEGDLKLTFHMAPPLLSKKDPVTGHLRKKAFGAWTLSAFKVLAKLKVLRGTPLDIFGKTAERKMERALIGEFEQVLDQVLRNLNNSNVATAAELIGLVMDIRGYGHVKEQAVEEYRVKVKQQLAAMNSRSAALEPVKFVNLT